MRTLNPSPPPPPLLIPTPPPLDAPRILCLHGGGTSGEIFRAQARALEQRLSPTFRLVFADGPWFCAAGPGVEPVYAHLAPFRRWLRWRPEHAAVDDDAAIDEIAYALSACRRDDPGSGPWVGLLGFSQGAKVAASLLYEQQVRAERDGWAETEYKFAVVMNGRGPLVSFSDDTVHAACARPGDPGTEPWMLEGVSPHVLRLPTIHVHGLRDPGLELHRNMMEKYHDPKSVTLVEWDGEHRVPIMRSVVERICDAIFRVARAQGVSV